MSDAMTRGSEGEPLRVILLADSLSFQGPEGIVSPDDTRLYPNVLARLIAEQLSREVIVDATAREGWTARDAWWALTKDPRVFAQVLPRADAVIIGVGGMDQLPAIMPTYLRDSMPYLRPGALRRKVRRAYRSIAPKIIGASGGLMRQLPQEATDRYLTRIVQAVRAFRGGIPILTLTPAPYEGAAYPSQKYHEGARRAMVTWGITNNVAVVDIEAAVLAGRAQGVNNPDGLHWGWDTHQAVGSALAERLLREVG